MAGIGQYCLVMRGATMPFKTVEVSSGERPLNNSISFKVPVIFHTTSVPSTFNATVEGISMRSWKSEALGAVYVWRLCCCFWLLGEELNGFWRVPFGDYGRGELHYDEWVV